MSDTITKQRETVEQLLKNGKGEIRLVVNGRNERLGTVTDVNVPYEAKTSEVSFIDTGDVTISEGYAKTGTMTLAYNASVIRDFVYKLSADDELPLCTLILENKGNAKVGSQRLVFNDVMLTSFSIFKAQAGKGTMTETVKFTYSSFQPTENFARAR